MEGTTNVQVQDIVTFFKRRKYQIIIPSMIIFAIIIIVTFALPNIYKSTCTILIEEQEIPLDFIRTTVTGYGRSNR